MGDQGVCPCHRWLAIQWIGLRVAAMRLEAKEHEQQRDHENAENFH